MVGLSSEKGNPTIRKLFENKKMVLADNKITTTDVEEIQKQSEYYKKMEKIERARRKAAASALSPPLQAQFPESAVPVTVDILEGRRVRRDVPHGLLVQREQPGEVAPPRVVPSGLTRLTSSSPLVKVMCRLSRLPK